MYIRLFGQHCILPNKERNLFFNINQSFRKTFHRVVTYSMLVYFICVPHHPPGIETPEILRSWHR